MTPTALAAMRESRVGREDQQDHAERLARARNVLGLAERSTARRGSGIDRAVLRPVPATTASPEEKTSPVVRQEKESLLPGALLPVPDPLRMLFPQQGLRPGSSLAVTGPASTSMLLALAAAAAGESAWCAVAGLRDLGLRCALEAGLDPARLAIVPARETQMPKILSALVDGVGVLVLGPDLDLPPALWRSLADRARTRNALLLAAEPPGRSDLRLETAGSVWTGLSRGSGRLRSRRVDLTLCGRGIAGERHAQVILPHVTGALAAVPSSTRGTGSGQDARTTGTLTPLHTAARRAG